MNFISQCRSKTKSRLKYIWFLAPFSFSVLFLRLSYLAADTWFLVTTGEYIVQNRVVPTVNPFTFHEGFSAICQQWLHCLLIYFLYDFGKEAALYAYTVLVYAAGCALIYKYMSYFTENAQAKLLILALFIPMHLTYGNTRPYCVTYLLFLAELILLEARRLGNKRAVYFIPLLSVLIVNIQASMWVFLFIFAAPSLFPDKMYSPKDLAKHVLFKNKDMYIAGAISFLCGFIGPLGANGPMYIIYSLGEVGAATTIIKEMLPAGLSDLYSFYCLVLCGITALYIFQHKTESSLSRIVMAAGTLLLAVIWQRNGFFIIFGLAPLLMPMLDGLNLRLPRIFPQKINTAFWSAVFVMFIAACAYTWSGISLEAEDNISQPILAADWLDENVDADEIVLFNEYDSGNYMEFRGYKTYIDARAEWYYESINKKADIYTEYINVVCGYIDFEEFLNKYGFTHLIACNNMRFEHYLRLSDEYEAVLEGSDYTLYVKVE